MSFSVLLRQARIDCGLSQQAVAEKLGVRQATYYVYERKEKPQIPSVEIAAKLAKICNVSLDYLAGLTDDPRPRPPRSAQAPAADAPSPATDDSQDLASIAAECGVAKYHAALREVLKAKGIEI